MLCVGWPVAVIEEVTRCSDKGFLPISVAAYLELLDWTARQTGLDSVGCTAHSGAAEGFCNDLVRVGEQLWAFVFDRGRHGPMKAKDKAKVQAPQV